MAPRRRWVDVLLAAAIAVITVTVWFPIVHNYFISLDDQVTVFQNRRLMHLSWQSFATFWMDAQAGLYAPLSYSALALVAMFDRVHSSHPAQQPDYMFYPLPYHAVDLGLHALVAVVVYFTLRRLLSSRWPSAAGALLFALHPMQVESVAWVSETSNLLCGLFSILAICLYLQTLTLRDDPAGAGHSSPAPRSRRLRVTLYILATEAYLFALASKPLAVVTPILATVVYWLTLDRQVVPVHDELSARSRRPFPWGLGFWYAIAIPFAILARRSQPIPTWWLVVPMWIRPLVAGDALSFYLRKLVWPALLLADYDRAPHKIQESRAAFYTWILPAFLAALLFMRCKGRRPRMLIAASAWFVAALAPVLGLVMFAYQHSSTVADRYIYLPMFGAALAAGWAIKTAWAKFPLSPKGRGLRVGLVLIVLASLCALTVKTRRQMRYWHDTKTLFEYSVQHIGRDPGAKEPKRWW